MSYFIQCDCGKKLTKKPIKTLVCPKCHSVYKKSKKFIYFIYFVFSIIGIIAMVLIGDNFILSVLYGVALEIFLWLFLIYYFNLDILDLIILFCGLYIFYYCIEKYDNLIFCIVLPIFFCWASAEIFIRFFPYKKQD